MLFQQLPADLEPPGRDGQRPLALEMGIVRIQRGIHALSAPARRQSDQPRHPAARDSQMPVGPLVIKHHRAGDMGAGQEEIAQFQPCASLALGHDQTRRPGKGADGGIAPRLDLQRVGLRRQHHQHILDAQGRQRVLQTDLTARAAIANAQFTGKAAIALLLPPRIQRDPAVAVAPALQHHLQRRRIDPAARDGQMVALRYIDMAGKAQGAARQIFQTMAAQLGDAARHIGRDPPWRAPCPADPHLPLRIGRPQRQGPAMQPRLALHHPVTPRQIGVQTGPRGAMGNGQRHVRAGQPHALERQRSRRADMVQFGIEPAVFRADLRGGQLHGQDPARALAAQIAIGRHALKHRGLAAPA